MQPRAPWVAWVDILPWDVMGDFREQIFSGFGIVHKMQKKRAAARTPKNKEGRGGGGNQLPDGLGGSTVKVPITAGAPLQEEEDEEEGGGYTDEEQGGVAPLP